MPIIEPPAEVKDGTGTRIVSKSLGSPAAPGHRRVVISPRRLCRDAEGRIVEADDPAAAFLVAGEGCAVPAGFVDAVETFLAAPEAKPQPKATRANPTPKPKD